MLCCAGFSAAQTGDIPENLNTPLSARTKVTYLDLVRKVFPDAQSGEERPGYLKAASHIPLRYLFGQSLPDIFKPNMYGEILVELEEKMETINDREKVLWLLMGAFEKSDGSPSNGGNRILAAFRVSATGAELIDAASVKTDDRTSLSNEDSWFSGKPKLMLVPRREAVVVYNMMQVTMGEPSFSIVGIGEKGFKVLLNQFDLHIDGRCGRYIEETANIRALKNSTSGYRNIEVVVTSEIGAGDEDAKGAGTNTVEWRRHYRYVFAWQKSSGEYEAIVDPGKARRAAHKRFNPCRYNAGSVSFERPNKAGL